MLSTDRLRHIVVSSIRVELTLTAQCTVEIGFDFNGHVKYNAMKLNDDDDDDGVHACRMATNAEDDKCV